MSRQIIAVDIDDVLAASAEAFVDFSNKRWGTKLTVDTYDEHWSRMWGIDQKETLKRAHVIYNSRVASNLRRFTEADKVLTKLSKQYQLVIITSRNRLVEQETLAWLAEHYKDTFQAVHMPGFFDDLKGEGHKRTKAELCQTLGVSYLIDDHPKHCLAAAKVGVTSLLFGDYAWSRHLKRLPKGVVRVADWHDIAEYFKV